MTATPYQLLPPLSADEYQALKADIAEHGIRVPVDVDEAGTILDGHHRAAVAAELGMDYPTRVVAGLDESGKAEHALTVNLARRQLTQAQRRDLIRAELDRDPDRSDRHIARLVGVDHKTVGAVRRGESPHLDHDRDPAERRADAERTFRQLQQEVVNLDYSAATYLLRGGQPTDLARNIMQATDIDRMNRAHPGAGDAWWEHIIKPRIDGLYQWPDAGIYRVRMLIALTWPEWHDYDPQTAVNAERALAKMATAGDRYAQAWQAETTAAGGPDG